MNNAANNRQRGIGLIEVLVTLVVVTLALLGIAGLQLQGLRSNQAAHWHIQATAMAYDLVERMRANRSVAAQGGYKITRNAKLPVPADCRKIRCSAQQLATQDLAKWKSQLATKLPQGDGEVSVTLEESGLEILITVLLQDASQAHPTEFQLKTLL